MVVVHLGAISKLVLLQLLGLSPVLALQPLCATGPRVRNLPSVCRAVPFTTTIIAFRLRRIMLDQPVAAGGRSSSGISMWKRAICLLLQELRLAPSSSARRTPPLLALHLQHETCYIFSTITLWLAVLPLGIPLVGYASYVLSIVPSIYVCLLDAS